MSPKEHQLSQEVLEFLIAHQDWFMLDIPPPPTSRENSTPASPLSAGVGGSGGYDDDDDVMVVPSSDEEHPSPEGGWKLVERGKRMRVDRRRTLSDRVRGETMTPVAVRPDIGMGELSPVSESSLNDEAIPGVTVSVTRSRTLPSRRTGAKDAVVADERHQKVLKKQKRASAQPPRSPPIAAESH